MADDKKKWLTPGGNSTGLWDPTQPEPDNQRIYRGQAKQLDLTQTVSAFKRNGGLVEVDDSDAKKMNDDYDAKIKDENAKANTNKKTVQNASADAKLEKAAQLEQEGKNALNEAKVKSDAANEVLKQNDLLQQQLKEANDKLDALAKTK
jgi:hypothetical protein